MFIERHQGRLENFGVITELLRKKLPLMFSVVTQWKLSTTQTQFLEKTIFIPYCLRPKTCLSKKTND